MLHDIAKKHKLSADQEARCAASLDYILGAVGIDGLEALKEIHQGSTLKAHFINDEINEHIKSKKAKPKRKFF